KPHASYPFFHLRASSRKISEINVQGIAMGEISYFQHPMIRYGSLEERTYQVSIFKACLKAPTLVVLATGLGKTAIAAMVIAERLYRYKNTRALMMAPTRPLVEQHTRFLRNVLNIDGDHIVSLSGLLSPGERASLWAHAKVVVATPQVVLNDLNSGLVPLESYSIVVFDEAHRAVGDYPYVPIARKYWEISWYPLVLGLTASPGNRLEDIIEVCTNLGIYNIEFRSERDLEVRKYIFKKNIEVIRVEVSKDVLVARRLLLDVLRSILRNLKSLGILDIDDPARISVKQLVETLEKVSSSDFKNPQKPKIMMLLGLSLRLHHAIEILDRHGPDFATKYLKESLFKRGDKSSALMVNDQRVLLAYNLIKNKRNPKVDKIIEILNKALNEEGIPKAIVFVEYRDVANYLEHVINEKVPNAKAKLFVGQGYRKGVGMSQREQLEVIERFRRGDYNVLIATSVAEEGLDIPETDLVIFYEAIPSKVRTIQRKGRTGRHREGKVVILVSHTDYDVTKDTIYYHVTKEAEEKIRRLIKLALPKIREKNRELYNEFLIRNDIIKKSTKKRSTIFDFLKEDKI
ncbi:MAG: Hef nuclease, partial [Thermoplasmata archaeon]